MRRRVRAAVFACPIAIAACANILGIEPAEPRDAGPDGPSSDGSSTRGDSTFEGGAVDAPGDAALDGVDPGTGDGAAGGKTIVDGLSSTVLVAATDSFVYWARSTASGTTLWNCTIPPSDSSSCLLEVLITSSVSPPVNLVALGQGGNSTCAFATADGTIELYSGSMMKNIASGVMGLKAFGAAATDDVLHTAFFYSVEGGGAPGLYGKFDTRSWQQLSSFSGSPSTVVASFEAMNGVETDYEVAFTIPSGSPEICGAQTPTDGCVGIQVDCTDGCGVPTDHVVMPSMTPSYYAFAGTGTLWVTEIPQQPFAPVVVDRASDVTAITIWNNSIVWARRDGALRVRQLPLSTGPKVLGSPGVVRSLASNKFGVYAALDDRIIFYPGSQLP
jgi:hypothetical protein